MNRKILSMVLILLGAASLLTVWGLNRAQVVSTCIVLLVISGTLFYWERRLVFALFGLAVLLCTGLIDVPHLIEFAGLDIILFLVGMMLLIGFLEDRQFFEYLMERLVEFVGPHGHRLVIVILCMAALAAALVDEVTSILFMSATMIQLTKRYKVPAIPFIMMVVFTTNVGSSATVVGNPIGVIIALRAGLTFSDFIRWATPLSIMALLITLGICLLYFSKELAALDRAIKERHQTRLHLELDQRKGPPKDNRLCWTLFALTVAGLIGHHPLEELFHLQKNTMLLGVALLAGGAALALAGEKARELFDKRVDWWTLAFFLALFASVGTLKYVGTTGLLAGWVSRISQGNPLVLLTTVGTTAGLLTAFMDNVLAVATLIPVVKDLGALGVQTFPLWWILLFAGTVCGNATIIGSTANIVAAGVLEREKEGRFGFMAWAKPGVLVSVIPLVIAIFLLFIQIPFMPK